MFRGLFSTRQTGCFLLAEAPLGHIDWLPQATNEECPKASAVMTSRQQLGLHPDTGYEGENDDTRLRVLILIQRLRAL
jgi:hypothetical protein